MIVKTLNSIIENTNNIVCICGSGTASDCGYPDIWDEDFAFYIEKKYGFSPEDIYNVAYYETRREQFFKFYRDEMIRKKYKPSATYYKLAELEREGKLKCVITKNIYDLPERAGCKNVINLHGSISNNVCPKCMKKFSEEILIASKKYPVCPQCQTPIKLGVSLVGDMLDNVKITRAMEAISMADVLLVLDASLSDEEFGKYVSCYKGDKMIVIKDEKNYNDIRADYFIKDKSSNVMAKLGRKSCNIVMFDKREAVVNN